MEKAWLVEDSTPAESVIVGLFSEKDAAIAKATQLASKRRRFESHVYYVLEYTLDTVRRPRTVGSFEYRRLKGAR